MRLPAAISGLYCCALLAACGAETDHPPEVAIDTASLCPKGVDNCINAATKSYKVEGVRVIHKQIKGEPLVALDLFYDSSQWSGHDYWSEHVALQLLEINGTRELNTSQWNEELTKIGAEITAGGNADYSYLFADVIRPYWDRLWKLLFRAFTRPADDEYLIDNIIRYTSANFDNELDEPDSAASITAWSQLLENTRYNRARENRDELKAITSDRIPHAWNELMQKERVWIVVVGDVDWEDLREKVRQAEADGRFGDLPMSNAYPAEIDALDGTQVTLLDYPNSPTWHIDGYFLGPLADDADTAALAVALAVLDRRLFTEVRDKLGLAYTVGARLYSYRQTIGEIWLTTDAPADALPAVSKIIADLMTVPPTDEELATLRRLATTDMLAVNRTPDTLANLLGHWQMTTGNRMNADAFLRDLEKVTPEQAQSALLRYVRDASLAAAGPGGGLTETQLGAMLPVVETGTN